MCYNHRMTFNFKIDDDKAVTILGMQTRDAKEIAGAGQTWRAWHMSGRGYQSGRDWKYGASSIWIVKTNDDKMMRYFDFEFGRKWQAGRKIITQIVEELNKNPNVDHTQYLSQLEKATRDWEQECQEMEPLERLKKAMLENQYVD